MILEWRPRERSCNPALLWHFQVEDLEGVLVEGLVLADNHNKWGEELLIMEEEVSLGEPQ